MQNHTHLRRTFFESVALIISILVGNQKSTRQSRLGHFGQQNVATVKSTV